MIKSFEILKTEKGIYQKIVIKDGGNGTVFEHEKGLGEDHIHINDIHKYTTQLGTEWILSGARTIGTHTFGASYEKLLKLNAQDRINSIHQNEIIRLNASIKNAKKQESSLKNQQFLKYGTIGPKGNCYRTTPIFNSVEEATSHHLPQIEAFYSNGIPALDFILAETNPEVTDLLGIYQAIRTFDKDIKIIPSFYLGENHGKKGKLAASQISIEEAIEILERTTNEDVEAMINCCDIDTTNHGLKNMKYHHDKIIGIYTNPHGETDELKLHSHELITYKPDELIDLKNTILNLKTNYIPNFQMVSICCGATPETLKKLNQLINS